ncbi:MAG: hypothetical protein ABIJ96_14985 [Elusimicrobiota bacterium]
MTRFVAIIAAVVLGAAGAVWVVVQNRPLLVRKYEEWRYPPINTESDLSGALKKDIELRRYNEVAREYQRVQRLLVKAESEGKDVEWLKRKMPRVARLLREGKLYFAKIHLNTIVVRIPRDHEKVLPAGAYDHNEGMTPDVKGRAKKVQPRSKRRRGGKKQRRPSSNRDQGESAQ